MWNCGRWGWFGDTTAALELTIEAVGTGEASTSMTMGDERSVGREREVPTPETLASFCDRRLEVTFQPERRMLYTFWKRECGAAGALATRRRLETDLSKKPSLPTSAWASPEMEGCKVVSWEELAWLCEVAADPLGCEDGLVGSQVQERRQL